MGKKDRIITYCGGAIAGSCIAVVLLLLGYENVSVYDGSMEEWGRDPTLPIEK
jgi:thiosulfate/3-mercaptopyruvate sulfurtransferase